MTSRSPEPQPWHQSPGVAALVGILAILGAVFAFAGGFVPPRWWPMISPAAGVFGLGLLGGALLR